MNAEDPDLARLAELREETMRRAWGPRSPEDRRRIAAAARIFGRQFREQAFSQPAVTDEQGSQRLLMAVISASIKEFAEQERLDEEAAAAFLGDLGTRDLVLEFDEVLEAYEAQGTSRTLDELLLQAVESRPDKARQTGYRGPG